MRTRRILLAVVATALLGAAFVAYPLYPSDRSICGIMDERARDNDRWGSPHRGAVVLLSGDLYGMPMAGSHVYAFRTQCKGYDYFLAIDNSPNALQSVATHNTLEALQRGDWNVEETHAPFTIVARVESEVQGCFGPPMVLQALAMQSRGEVRVDRRDRPLR